MGLDIAHGRGVDLRDRMRLGDDIGLPGCVGGGERHLRRPVIVQRRSPDHGVNAVPVVDCGLQRLEDDNSDSAAEDGAVRPHVERSAVAGCRHHRTGFVPVPDVVRDSKRRATGQGHLGFTVQNALAGQVNCDQRRRACRLHRQGGATQVELVRHPRREIILVVLQRQVDHLERDALPDDHVRVLVRHQVVQQVSACRARSRTRRPNRRCPPGRSRRLPAHAKHTAGTAGVADPSSGRPVG